MIGAGGGYGWMSDFGEAMPFDAKLHGGADPAVWHNRYSMEWLRVNREAIEESGRGDEMVFFARAGFTQSPGVATLFWLGDQMRAGTPTMGSRRRWSACCRPASPALA